MMAFYKHSYLAWQGDIGYTSTPLFRHFQSVLATKMKDRSQAMGMSAPIAAAAPAANAQQLEFERQRLAVSWQRDTDHVNHDVVVVVVVSFSLDVSCIMTNSAWVVVGLVMWMVEMMTSMTAAQMM